MEIGSEHTLFSPQSIGDDCTIAETEGAALAKLIPAQRNHLEELCQTQLIGTPAIIRQRL